MANRESRELERFMAIDGLGNEYMVLIHQEFIESRAMGREPQWIPGLKSIELSNGDPVNFIDKNTFLIVKSGRKITRSDQ